MSRLLPVLAAVAAVLLAGCGADDATVDEEAGGSAPAATDPAAADLPDGVAAQVGDAEIATDRLQARVDSALDNPELEARLPDDPQQARPLVEASVLSQMIVTEAVLQAADEEGIEVTDEDIAAKRQELEQQAGGADALEQQIDAIGFSEQELERELRTLAILQRVGEREAPEAAPTASPAAGQADPTQAAAQEWLRQQLTDLRIVVDAEHGRWDAQRLQVVPPQTQVPAATPTS